MLSGILVMAFHHMFRYLRIVRFHMVLGSQFVRLLPRKPRLFTFPAAQVMPNRQQGSSVTSRFVLSVRQAQPILLYISTRAWHSLGGIQTILLQSVNTHAYAF